MKAGVMLLALWCGAVGHGMAANKPNVLFICVDDLKPTLGCYGDKVVKSPNVDRLAARSVVFERAYCNQAVCAPSRNALMTGVRPTTMGIYDLGTNFRLASSNAVTLSAYFMRHGYRAEALGKIFHVGHGNHEDAASWSAPHFKANSIAYVLPENRADKGLTREEALFANDPVNVAKLPRGAAYESADVADNAYPDGKIAEEAIRRLRGFKEKPAEPFFLAVGFLKPHLPFCAPKKYWDLYERSSFKVPEQRSAPEGAPKFGPSGWGELRQYSGIPTNGPVSEEQARTLIHGYYAAVSYMDAQLGKVLVELDRLNLATNTIIVLWGDHGWHLGDHGWWCKHTNYEQANRIPLMVAAPGVRGGARAKNALIETVDIYPTLAELAGLPAPQVTQRLEGKSFAAVLREPDRTLKDFVFHVYPRGQRIGQAVRTARYRLVEWKVPGAAPDTAEFELYDYEKDPLETKNLAAERADIVSRMREMLATLPEAKPQIQKPKSAGSDRGALFARKDTNKDGKLTREEFLAGQRDPDEAPARFIRFDADKDGALTREEFIDMGNAPKR
jgi:iduronate 2-sulfatase